MACLSAVRRLIRSGATKWAGMMKWSVETTRGRPFSRPLLFSCWECPGGNPVCYRLFHTLAVAAVCGIDADFLSLIDEERSHDYGTCLKGNFLKGIG